MEAGKAMVEERGLTASLEHLSFEEVIKRADVPRSAAYRVFANKETYYFHLVCELAGPDWHGKAAFDTQTMADTVALIFEHQQKLATPAERRWLLEEIVRHVVPPHFLNVSQSTQWLTFVTLTATLLSLEEGEVKTEIQIRLRDSESRLTARMAKFYRVMAKVLGLRLKSPFRDDYLTLTTIGTAIIEGMALRYLLAPEVGQTQYSVEQGGSRTWSLPAVGFMGVIDIFMEVDPDYNEEKAWLEFVNTINDYDSSGSLHDEAF